MESLRTSLSGVRRETWLRWCIAVGGVLVVVAFSLLWGPGDGDATRRLEEKYGVDQVVWDRGSKVRPEKLVVDGRDISDECTVRGAWFSLEDVEIVCVRDMGIGRIEIP